MKDKKAISLIVLVITIIVMIILAGTMILTLNELNILNEASRAVEETDRNTIEQLASLAWAEAYADAHKDGEITEEKLQKRVDEILKNSGIKQLEEYDIIATITGVKVTEKDNWDHAYTCTNGVWSERIEKGNPINGDIVAKFYKTGKKITLAEDIITSIESSGGIIDAQQDEYRLVIVGKGEMGALHDDNGSYAWYTDLGTITNDTCVTVCTTEVIIENGVQNISDYAFDRFLSLTSITIPSSVMSIGETAFFECISLPTITLGTNIQKIGQWAFQECKGVTSIIIPNSVKEIGNQAFGFCSNLKTATIGSGVETIGARAFIDCTGLTNVIIENGVSVIGEYAFKNCNRLTGILIPNSVKDIGEYAFADCKNMKTVEMGSGVEKIGTGAFSSLWVRNFYYAGSEEDWEKIEKGVVPSPKEYNYNVE